MADTITVTYKVNEDGSLKAIGKDAERAAASQEKLNKKKNRYNRQEKGVGALTANSTKAFSKQAQTVGGTLVPAYAVLAANVFAITAAFGVLQRSGGVQKLEEGLNFTGRAAGQNLPYIADRLREITGAAVSTAEAMKSVAVGISAGFSQGQMEGLTRVAKGASLALGRDMTDALDRLTRGAAKLEPEILDELGILVRLDEVSQAYAASVGKSVSALSSFEKRMAFTNAIIDQGTKKFGALSKVMDENPYNKLSATLADLTQTLLKGLSVALNPLVSLLASSPMALLGVLVLFGSTLLKQLVPAMDIVISRQKALANAAAVSAKKASKVISKEYTKAVASVSKAFKTVPPSVKKMEKEIRAGTLSTKQLKAAIVNLAKSEKLRAVVNKRAGKALSAVKRQELLEIRALQAEMLKLQAIEKDRMVASGAGIRSSGKSTASGLTARGLNEISNSTSLMGGFAKAAKYSGLQMANLGKPELVGVWNKIAVGARAATGAVTLFGRAALNAIPYIGQILFVGSLLYPLFKKFFSTPTTLVSETMEGIRERMEELNNVTAQMATTYLEATTNAERFFIVLHASSGVTQQFNDAMAELINVQEAAKIAKLVAARKKLYEAQETQAKVAKGEQASQMSWWRKWAAHTAAAEMAQSGAIDQAQELLAITKEGALEKAKVLEAEQELEAIQSTSAISTLETKEGMIELLHTEISTYEVMKKVAYENAEEVELLNTKIKATKGFLLDLKAEVDPKIVLAKLRAWNIAQQNILNSAKAAKQHVADLIGVFEKGNKPVGEFAEYTTALTAAMKDLDAGVNWNLIIQRYKEIFQLFGLKEDDVGGLKGIGKRIGNLQAEIAGQVRTKSGHDMTTGLREMAGLEVAASQSRQSSLNAEILIADKKAEMWSLLRRSIKASKEEARAEMLKLSKIKEQNKEIAARVAIQSRLGSSAMGSVAAAIGYGQKSSKGINIDEVTPTSEKIQILSKAIQPMLKDLEKLGPDGALVSSAMMGTLQVSESFQRLTEELTELGFNSEMTFEQMKARWDELSNADKIKIWIAGLSAAGTAVAALGNVMAAAAQANISGIERQIAAEKRRDGQSSASLAKLKSLEAKKEGMKRKEFETNKKFQMANAIIAVAVGVAQAYAIPYIGIPLAAMIAALGAAQVAIISGMTYQGGGAGGVKAPSPISAISMGSRGNKVDIAGGRGNAAGELAYLRGARGSGQSARDFRPAFAGARHRAGGGYVVGEQGPELFMPEMPGQIIPSGQGAGGQTNVNFTINAIDSIGMEEALVSQRGNIIGMIRESANEYGTNFLEGVDTEVYTDTTEGTIYGRA